MTAVSEAAEEVRLRAVSPDDLPVFFKQQQDPASIHMVAYTARDPRDRAAFDRHWAKILADPPNTLRTVVVNGVPAGYVTQFVWSGVPEVGYWIGREFWGRGIATEALRQFLDLVPIRPLAAHVAKDNVASLRVLQKCGFEVVGEGSAHSRSRGQGVEKFILCLGADQGGPL